MRTILALSAITMIALGSTAQSYTAVQSATLQHDGVETVYYGNGAFAAAYAAAADTLDVIYLSGGSFVNPGEIKKSITVYGAGFEADPDSPVQRTYVQGQFNLNPTEDTKVNGCHFEGICFESHINIQRVVIDEIDKHVYNIDFIKCEFQDLNINAVSHFVTVRQCYARGYIRGNNVCAVQSLVIQNCFIGARVYDFPTTVNALSSVLVDHCILPYTYLYSSYEHGPYVYTNSIINGSHASGSVSSGATINGCLYIGHSELGDGRSGTANYFLNDWADVFTDGDNATYATTRTFEVKEDLIGVDGQPIGVVGGIGWRKFTSLPRVTDLETVLSEDGKSVKVTIKADVPE